MKSLPFLAATAVLACSAANAAVSIFNEAVLVHYGATPGNEFAPTVVGSGLAAGMLGPGTSLANLEAGATLPGTVFFNPTLPSASAGEAFLNDQFFEFTLSSLDGLRFFPLTLTFTASNGGGSTPRGWAIHTSLDGFADPLASSDVTQVQPGSESFAVDLDALGLSADELVFRIYGYSPAEGEGIFFDDIEIAGFLESLVNPVFRPELLLGAASSVIHGGRLLHREIEQQSLGRVIPTGECFHAWGDSGIDWFGGGSGESHRASGGLAFRLPHGLVGQAAGSVELTRGAPIDTDTVRLGFALDNGKERGLQWLGYLGGFTSDFETSRSGKYSLGSGILSLDTSGTGFQAAGAVAWWMRHGAITWGPTAGLEYLRMELDSASFIGGVIPASVTLDDADSLRSLIGLRGRHEPLKYGIQPFASAQLATEWSGAGSGLLHSAAGTASVQDPNGRGTSLIMDAGLSVPVWQGAAATVSYLGEMPLSGNGTESHGLHIGLECFF